MRRAAALIAGAVLALPGPVARADAFTPPALVAAGGSQEGAPVYATVNRSVSATVCQSRHADYPGAYPAAIEHHGGALVWRIADPRKPASVSVLMWRLGTDQSGLGPDETLAVALQPVKSRGRTVAWEARSGDAGYGDLHLSVSVTWPKGRCGSDSGRYRYRLTSLPQPPAR